MDSLLRQASERALSPGARFKDGPRKTTAIDEELEELVNKQKAKIKVFGVGGGGNNTINRIAEVGIVGAETIALNTDAQDLLYTTADAKILIGKELTAGLGAGSIPKIGEDAAKESEKDIKEKVQGSDIVFVTIPFSMEGQRRYANAIEGLEKLEQIVDTLIVIPNDKLLELCPGLPLHTAFKVADEILTNAVKGIAELV